MPRIATFLLFLLTAIALESRLELYAVRGDFARMESAYSAFLSSKVHGKPLEEQLKPGSLAVMKSQQGVIACGVMR